MQLEIHRGIKTCITGLIYKFSMLWLKLINQLALQVLMKGLLHSRFLGIKQFEIHCCIKICITNWLICYNLDYFINIFLKKINKIFGSVNICLRYHTISMVFENIESIYELKFIKFHNIKAKFF